MAFGLHSGSKVVTTAGTAERLVSTNHEVQAVFITAMSWNTAYIAVGDSSVIAAHTGQIGVILDACDTVTLYNVDLYDIFIDATTSGEGVTYTWQE